MHVVSGANKSASLTVSGTLANLNAALNGLIFTPATGYVGNASLAVTLANPTTGLSNSSGLALTVNAVSQSHQSSVGGNSGHGGRSRRLFQRLGRVWWPPSTNSTHRLSAKGFPLAFRTGSLDFFTRNPGFG